MKAAALAIVGLAAGAALGWSALHSARWDLVVSAIAGLEWQVLVAAVGAVLFAVDPTTALTFALVIHAVLFLPPVVIGVSVLARGLETLQRLVATVTPMLRPALALRA